MGLIFGSFVHNIRSQQLSLHKEQVRSDYWPSGLQTGPRSAVGNLSGYRCVSDCRSRGREFDPGPVPYFRGD